MKKTLAMVETSAKRRDTPIVLMGYYNPIYIYGVDRFLTDANAAGVDGLIVVDMPPEEDAELRPPARGGAELHPPRYADDRRQAPAGRARQYVGFVYYVSIAGITGTAAPDLADVGAHVARIKAHTELPIAVGFGVKTEEQVSAIAKLAEGVVVGSALVGADRPKPRCAKARPRAKPAASALALVEQLAAALRSRPKPPRFRHDFEFDRVLLLRVLVDP